MGFLCFFGISVFLGDDKEEVGHHVLYFTNGCYFVRVVTKLDTPKSDYRESTGTKWLVLVLGLV